MGFPVRSDSVRRWMQTVLGETLVEPALTEIGRFGLVVVDAPIAWANSAPLQTEVVVDVPACPASLIVAIYNPSTVTDLEWNLLAHISFGGTVRDACYVVGGVRSWNTMPKASGSLVASWVAFAGAAFANGGHVVVRNKTALGASDGFTGRLVVVV